ncbi:hypothetical protein NDU88_006899 [Pleurodeles waltl]|uniref:Uncharacterized protein n=1 Tax=Pleurodeles waltl TaxID=8319 RepID=A0AAV7MDK2_PLEWA|nr:hypothetical protein NDU88_006899 [Pleurodeles waltl]
MGVVGGTGRFLRGGQAGAAMTAGLPLKVRRLAGDARGGKKGGARDRVSRPPLGTRHVGAVCGARLRVPSATQDKLRKGKRGATGPKRRFLALGHARGVPGKGEGVEGAELEASPGATLGALKRGANDAIEKLPSGENQGGGSGVRGNIAGTGLICDAESREGWGEVIWKRGMVKGMMLTTQYRFARSGLRC